MKLDFSSWMSSAHARHPIGVDIGTSSVKVVQVRRSGHAVRITGAFSAEIPRQGSERPSPERVAESLKALIADNAVRADRAAGSFPLSSALVRTAVVPFKGNSKIRQVIKFQAEPHIPFAIEEVVIDFHETGASDEEKTPVMIVGAKKELIGKQLELFAGAGLNPESLGVDVVALINNYLFRAGDAPGDELVALLEMGASKMLLALLRGNAILLARSITVGGDDFTEAIQKATATDFQAAERLKREAGSAVAPASAPAEEENLHRALSPVLARIAKELDRSLRSVSASLKGGSLSRIYLAGGGALLRGMREFCAKEFGCEAHYLSSLSPLTGSGTDEVMCTTAIAAGLALQAVGCATAEIDLRREEFTHAGPIARVRRQLTVAAALGICVAGLALYNFISSFITHRHDYNILAGKLEQVYRQTFPGEPRVRAAAVLPKMEQKLKDYQETYKNFSALSSSAISSLDVLRELSALIPPDIKAQVTEFSISQGRLELDGLLNNPADADRIKKSLGESGLLRGVDVPSTSSYEGNKYKFKLMAELYTRTGS